MSLTRHANFNAIIDRVFLTYNKLMKPKSKNSKLDGQWTHLAAICYGSVDQDDINLLCMATGTRCLGAKDIDHNGFRLNDSHAEVLCRRIFIKFLLDEINKLFSCDDYESAYFMRDAAKDGRKTFTWRCDQKLIMILTHTPCGDASIFPKSDNENDDVSSPSKIRRKDINRTGAKPIPGQVADDRLPGVDYHRIGSFRTKPGRGDPTISMSCSDKMAKWQVVGLQGSLASYFVSKPICFDVVIVASEHYSFDSMKRALCDRIPAGIGHELAIVNVPTKFANGKHTDHDNMRPNPICKNFSELNESKKRAQLQLPRLHMKISNILRQNIVQLGKLSDSKPKTIYALSSGFARSGIAIIRVSGDNAKNALRLMTNLGRKPEIKPRYMYCAQIKNPVCGEIIDSGMAVWFPGPHSFTGEDTCEFHIHGGPAVISDVLQALAQVEGLRPAEAGEFSKRAFFNGKLDLTTAEGLADLLNAETSAQRKLALRQAAGDLKKLYFAWREKLIKCLAHVEAYIDFSEEESIEDDVMDNVNNELSTLRGAIIRHLEDSRMGERLRNGLQVAIVGKPNVGKSSLLNHLCKRPAAIVSPVPGTTRDTLEVPIDIAGFPILLMDTAGIRQTDDIVEKEGVERSRKKLSEADIVIVMIETDNFRLSRNIERDKVGDSETDCYHSSTNVMETYLNYLFKDVSLVAASDLPEILILVNKIDKLNENTVFKVEKLIWREKAINVCWISCLNERGMDEFLRQFTSLAELLCGRTALSSANPLFTQQRHRHLVTLALSDLDRYFQSRDNNLVVAADHLRRIIHHIGSLTGQVTTEDILDCVFRDFCIGK